MKKILILAVLFGLLGCKEEIKEDQKKEPEKKESCIKEERLEIDSYYIYKKIYVTDHFGWTHEILVATSGNTAAGVEMLELSVYPEKEVEYGEE